MHECIIMWAAAYHYDVQHIVCSCCCGPRSFKKKWLRKLTSTGVWERRAGNYTRSSHYTAQQNFLYCIYSILFLKNVFISFFSYPPRWFDMSSFHFHLLNIEVMVRTRSSNQFYCIYYTVENTVFEKKDFYF